MKRTLFLSLAFILISFSLVASNHELKQRLTALPGIQSVESLKTNQFDSKYLLRIVQPLDHAHPELGTFTQRVFVSHVGYDRPTVLVTEGYGAKYAMGSNYREELSKLFNTNMVFVEHRYFLESTPDSLNWDYLTAEQSAYDLHHVTTLMKELYKEKWISTGISKGGQTTLIYRTYFPDDVDISVPYVAPLCSATEDGRHEGFIDQISTAKDRKIIRDYQLSLLKRRDQFMPKFTAYCEQANLSFKAPLEEIFDYCVLEYPFAFRQWGVPIESVPFPTDTDTRFFDHLMRLSDPSYFALNQPNLSFFVQAARELGYYGYDIEPFKEYLKIKTSHDYLNRLMIPEGVNIEFRPALYNKISAYLASNDPKMIFIYGEDDPWTAAGVTYLKDKKNIMVAIEPAGSHTARISTLPKKTQKQVLARITQWLAE
jgi:hypothetical protein